MPVHPQIQALLDKGTGVPATHTLPVAEARRLYEARIPLMAPAAEIGVVREQQIEGPGGPLTLRFYTPVTPGRIRCVVFFHGSGFVLCSLDTHDGMCRNLCGGGDCVVVSVDYRLAPEHKFPAPLDDCVAATRWAVEHARELGADPTRTVVAGDSAGGNLAAAAALRLRDEGGPPLCGQLLIYPVTDYHTPGTPSYRGERRRLRPDARHDGVVLGPLSRHPRRCAEPLRRAVAGGGLAPACRRLWSDRRIRPAAR